MQHSQSNVQSDHIEPNTPASFVRSQIPDGMDPTKLFWPILKREGEESHHIGESERNFVETCERKLTFLSREENIQWIFVLT